MWKWKKNQLSYFKQMEKENVQTIQLHLFHFSMHVLFQFQKNQFQITPNNMHINCIIDTLGRAEYLEEAENIIKEMKEPDIIIWKTLLGACRWNHDMLKEQKVLQKMH